MPRSRGSTMKEKTPRHHACSRNSVGHHIRRHLLPRWNAHGSAARKKARPRRRWGTPDIRWCGG
eukprot:6840351-Pyramimonas_sp.AAC.1